MEKKKIFSISFILDLPDSNGEWLLSVIKMYSYFSFVFCRATEGWVVENIKSDVATLKVPTTMQKS